MFCTVASGHDRGQSLSWPGKTRQFETPVARTALEWLVSRGGRRRASPRRRGRSGRSAPARSRRPARPGAAATARRRAAARRGRPRSRAGTPRSSARGRRSAGWCRSRSPPVAERRAGVDAEGGHEQVGLDREVRGRKAERAAALVADDDHAFDLGRPPEHGRGARRRPRAAAARISRRRDALEERHGARVEAELRSSARSPRAAMPEAEVSPATTTFVPDRAEHVAAKSSGSRCCSSWSNVDDERLLDAVLREQLQPPLERREQLDAVAEREPRMRVEGDDRRVSPVSTAAAITRWCPRWTPSNVPIATARAARSSSAGAARPSRQHRPVHRHELARADDAHALVHAPPALPDRRAPSSPTSRGQERERLRGRHDPRSSASATENGPTSVRRSVRQCPPSASAIART